MSRPASRDQGDTLRFILDFARSQRQHLSEAEIIERFMGGDYDRGALDEPDGPREDEEHARKDFESEAGADSLGPRD